VFAYRTGTHGDILDRATIEWNCQRNEARSRHGATMKLARTLVEAGCPDLPWRAVGADGRVRFYGPSLHKLARRTIAEGDSRGLQLKPFVRRDGSTPYGLADAAE
jgi:hypothetical protein